MASMADVLQLEGPAFPQGGQLIDVQTAQQLIAALHWRHVRGGQSQAQAGGGDPLVERLGELLYGQQAALDLGRGAAPHVHGRVRPAADAGCWVAEPVGGNQCRHEGGVGALAVGKADLAAGSGGQESEAEEGDGLAGAGGADDGHGLAPELGRRDDVTALAPAGQVAVQGDPQRRGGHRVITRLGEQPGRLALPAALVDALATPHKGTPLGPAGGPLGVPHRQRGGQQPDREGQPHLGGQQVPEKLADRDSSSWRAEAEVESDVLPEVLRHKDVAA
jgi:hypothetical protein